MLCFLFRRFGCEVLDDIGCFSAINSQDNHMKTIGMLPMSPNQISPTFSVFTTKSMAEPFELKYNFDVNSLKKSTFNETHQTVIIVHGFKSGLAQWMIVNKRFYLLLNFNDYSSKLNRI